jgi:hypothetical protein
MRARVRIVRGLVRAILVSAAMLGSGVALAQETPSAANSALAQSLFEEGRELMEQGKYDVACERFSESNKLDPGGGTLLNLAVCHEREGRIATAYVEFNEALGFAVREGRKDREQLARERISALGPVLPRVHLSLAGPAPPGLELRMDGAALALQAAMPNAPSLPVDPGPHRLTATAPNHVSVNVDVMATRGASAVELIVPRLASAVNEPPGSRGGKQASSRGRTIAEILTFGMGGALLGVGVGFGVDALVKEHESNQTCPMTSCSNMTAVTQSAQAGTAASVADVAIGVGLASIGVGTYLLLSSRPRHVQNTARGVQIQF